MRHSIVAAAGFALAGTAGAADIPMQQLDQVVVTATRFADSDFNRPVTLTVLTREDIEGSAAKTVPDLLSEQAGIAIRDFFGNNASTTTVDMRGFGAAGGQNTLILIDGRRAGDIDLSGVQWSALPLDALERIEIMRGAGGVLYGDGATAGVINLITRRPPPTGRGISILGRAGSYSMRDGQVHGYLASPRAALSLSAGHFESDGYRANNQNRQSIAQADLRVPTPGGELRFTLGADRQGIRLPGARLVQPSSGINQLATDRRGTSTPLDYSQRVGNRAAVDWRHETGFGEIILGAGYRDKEQTSYFDFGGFPDYRTAALDVWSFTPRARITLPLFGRPNSLVAGVDWYRWDYALRRSNAASNIGQPFNVVNAEQETAAWYLHDTLTLNDRWRLTAGWRSERLRMTASDRHDPAAPGGAFGSGAPPADQREWEHAYELGARYQFAPGWAATARTGRSYRFANVDEIYETSPLFTNQFQFLRPQTALGHEAGVERRVPGLWWRATAFLIDVTDEIHLDPFTTGVGNTNLPPSRRRGLELEGRWQAARALTLGLAFTYTEARFREGVLPGGPFTATNVVIAGRTVPLVPRRKLNAHASWALAPATRLNALVSHVGDQYMENDEGNTLGAAIPAHTVVDMKLVHRRGDWTLSAALNNVFDEKYFNYAVRSQFVADRYNAYPLPGRNLWVALEYALK